VRLDHAEPMRAGCNLIANSDDYGRSAAVSAGIRHSTGAPCRYRHQRLGDDPATRLLRRGNPGPVRNPLHGLGVHLCLAAGHPILPGRQIPSLVDAHTFSCAPGFDQPTGEPGRGRGARRIAGADGSRKDARCSARPPGQPSPCHPPAFRAARDHAAVGGRVPSGGPDAVRARRASFGRLLQGHGHPWSWLRPGFRSACSPITRLSCVSRMRLPMPVAAPELRSSDCLTS